MEGKKLALRDWREEPPTGLELLELLNLWAEWIAGDRVTEDDDEALRALDRLIAYLPTEGVNRIEETVWPAGWEE